MQGIQRSLHFFPSSPHFCAQSTACLHFQMNLRTLRSWVTRLWVGHFSAHFKAHSAAFAMHSCSFIFASDMSSGHLGSGSVHSEVPSARIPLGLQGGGPPGPPPPLEPG